MATRTRAITEPHRTHPRRELQPHHTTKALIIAALICYLFRVEIRQIVGRWLTDSSWSHGFLIPIFSLYFIHQKKDRILRLHAQPNYLGLLFLVLAIGFYSLNRLSPSGYEYFCRVSIITTLGAVVFFLGGWGLMKVTWLPIGFLVFAVPLPERYYTALTIPMRQWAAAVASGLLNLVPRLDATANGVVINIFYKGRVLEPALDVAEACAGMRLLMAFLALGVAMAYLFERPLWQRIVLLASTAPIAIGCNVIRVTLTGFIYVLIHPKYAQGIYHDMLGMAMLPLAFGLYGFLAWFMSSLFIDESDGMRDNVVIRRRLQ